MSWGRTAPAIGFADRRWREPADPPEERVVTGRFRSRLSRCPEIDCVRHRLPHGLLAAAELRAAEINTGADQVLIASGDISEETYLRDLCAAQNIVFEPLDAIRRHQIPVDDSRMMQSMLGQMLPIIIDGELVVVTTLSGLEAHHLVTRLAHNPEQGRRLRLTTTERLTTFVRSQCAAAIKYRAARRLKREHPDYCAGARTGRRLMVIGATLTSLAAALWFNIEATVDAIHIALALIFMSWIALRLFGALTAGLTRSPGSARRDDELPHYSVIVALYREAASVPGLISALNALDYPREKLDIKLVIEPDDDETRIAIEAARPGWPFEIVTVPAIAPRTKPKALNVALASARGELLAIYDAEDRPEPNQLRIAAATFDAHNETLACVQARLTIDNTGDSWITRLFTAEYAGLFDVFLPGLAAWHLPLPLGGSSNHFRTRALRGVGGWDPYNVTEDADLGMRLARFGYRTAMIASTTYEEAPARFGPWLRQRTRWFKGWMQTWLVHMRRPVRSIRNLGFPGFVVFQLVVGGTVLASLVHLVFALALAWEFAAGSGLFHGMGTGDLLLTGLHGTTLVTGYAISGCLGLIGLARRRLLRTGWWLLLMPLYWLLLSLAAWRALFQLAVAPYRWEKTEHGLAKSSRFAESPDKQTRDISEDPRQRPRAAA